jgi:hypothetical protein
MGSSNAVRVACIEEVTYGVTPGAGNFDTVRFISESLSGTPDTVESQQIRTDRLSSGQIVTGLTVGGDLGFELAKESVLEKFMASAMYSDWVTSALVTVDLEIAGAVLTRSSGSWITAGIQQGDFITLSGFSTAGNNTVICVGTVVDATTLEFVGPAGIADEVGTGTAYKLADKLSIGTTKKSFSIEKKFTDLAVQYGINYRGMIVNGMDLNVAFGELISGTFKFSGNDYQAVTNVTDLITNARTLNAAATTNTLNGSVDMPILASDVQGSFDAVTTFDIQSVAISLNNNLNAQNVIGDVAPKDYSAGTAQIGIDMATYLNADSWQVLSKKLTQDSFSLAFMVKNAGGWYAFYMPAIQVSFEDPSAGGPNQDVMLNMTGSAKVGATGEKSLYIFRG